MKRYNDKLLFACALGVALGCSIASAVSTGVAVAAWFIATIGWCSVARLHLQARMDADDHEANRIAAEKLQAIRLRAERDEARRASSINMELWDGAIQRGQQALDEVERVERECNAARADAVRLREALANVVTLAKRGEGCADVGDATGAFHEIMACRRVADAALAATATGDERHNSEAS